MPQPNTTRPPLRVYWWNEHDNFYHGKVNNFGDLVTPDLIRALFHREVEWAPIAECELLATGSILGIANGKGNYVWGSGFIEDGAWFNPDLRYVAVRGKLSRARLGERWRKLPLGDPGILASLVYPATGEKSDKIGVVPHYVDVGLPVVKRLQTDERFIVIDPRQAPAEVARAIARCRLVLSSSLHGLIFADSYRVPNARLVFSDNLTGGDYKFLDYDSGVDKITQVADVGRLFDDAYLTELIRRYRGIHWLKRKQQRLIRAFPRELM